MSKGSGSARATNSRTAHGSGANSRGEAKVEKPYESPKLKNGQSASELTDNQIEFRLDSNRAIFEADKPALRIEAQHRAEKILSKRMKELPKLIQNYENAKKAFEDKYGSKPAALIPLKQRAQYRAENQAIFEMRKEIHSTPTLGLYAPIPIRDKFFKMVLNIK